MNNNPNSLSAISLAVSTVLTESLSPSDLNSLGLFLSVLGDMLQLNYWEIVQNQQNTN